MTAFVTWLLRRGLNSGVRKTIQGFEAEPVFGKTICKGLLVEIDRDELEEELFYEKKYPA